MACCPVLTKTEARAFHFSWDDVLTQCHCVFAAPWPLPVRALPPYDPFPAQAGGRIIGAHPPPHTHLPDYLRSPTFSDADVVQEAVGD